MNSNTSARKRKPLPNQRSNSGHAQRKGAVDARSLRDNGLTMALFGAFALSLIGMIIAGYHHQNEQLLTHGLPAISIGSYLVDQSFLSALFENWESEWLQMATYVVLTAYLFQRGWAKSHDADGKSAKRQMTGSPSILQRCLVQT